MNWFDKMIRQLRDFCGVCWVCVQYEGRPNAVHKYMFAGGTPGHCPACGREVSDFIRKNPDYRHRSTIFKAECATFQPAPTKVPTRGW